MDEETAAAGARAALGVEEFAQGGNLER